MRTPSLHLSMLAALAALAACTTSEDGVPADTDVAAESDAAESDRPDSDPADTDPADTDPPDTDLPPPPFPLQPGDTVQYAGLGVVKCEGTLGGTCAEKRTTWLAEYTVQAPGASLDASASAWELPVAFTWTVTGQVGTHDAAFLTLDRLWLAGFGPWDEDVAATDTTTGVYRTDTPLLLGGQADTAPFFDLSQWGDGAEAFEDFVRAKDASATVTMLESARKLEAGYLEPSDTTQLHFIQLIYHRHGMLCAITEAIGTWNPSSPKNASGFQGGVVDYEVTNFPVKLRRAAGDSFVTCKCGTQSIGSDCE